MASTCRDTDGTFDRQSFQTWSCSRCFEILFHNTLADTAAVHISTELNISYGLQVAKAGEIRHEEPNTASDSYLCRLLNNDADCDRWVQCCEAASRCCDRQQQLMLQEDHCQATWDGLACWEPAINGSIVSQVCPSYFIAADSPSSMAARFCTENATWALGYYGREFTDYGPCFDDKAIGTMKKFINVVLTTSTACHALSVTALCLSLVVFFLCRRIRGVTTRLMLKLHTLLFFSFLGLHVSFLLFENAIYADSLHAGQSNLDTLQCRILQVVLWYLRSVTYWSLFCEVYYLRRRISLSTTYQCESFRLYLLIALVAPVFPVVIAVVFRFTYNTKSCWLPGQQNDAADYILHAPNLTVIAVNLCILCHIQRTIMFAMGRVRQNEAAVTMAKRGIRIAVCLTPVYGIQGLFLAYRPEKWFWYDLIEAVSLGGQGLIVSLFYAALNLEIRKELRTVVLRWRSRWNAVTSTSTFTMSSQAALRPRRCSGSRTSTDFPSGILRPSLSP